MTARRLVIAAALLAAVATAAAFSIVVEPRMRRPLDAHLRIGGRR